MATSARLNHTFTHESVVLGVHPVRMRQVPAVSAEQAGVEVAEYSRGEKTHDDRHDADLSKPL